MQYLICFLIGCFTPSWKWCWGLAGAVILLWSVVLGFNLWLAFQPLQGDKDTGAIVAVLAGGLVARLVIGAAAAALGHGLRLLLRPPSAYEKDQRIAEVFAAKGSAGTSDGPRPAPVSEPKP